MKLTVRSRAIQTLSPTEMRIKQTEQVFRWIRASEARIQARASQMLAEVWGTEAMPLPPVPTVPDTTAEGHEPHEPPLVKEPVTA